MGGGERLRRLGKTGRITRVEGTVGDLGLQGLDLGRDAGLQGIKICSDGRYAELLYVPGGGFRSRPYWKPGSYDDDMHIPRMDGKELFKFAVTKLPKTAREVCARHGVSIEQIDVFLAHQANQRINEYIRKDLGVPVRKLPSNIERFGNTSGATSSSATNAASTRRGESAVFIPLPPRGGWSGSATPAPG